MKEVPIQELDQRLQKQFLQAREALKKGGCDYVVQVCLELLKKNPSAYEVRALLWESTRPVTLGSASPARWLRSTSSGFQFKLANRSLLKHAPLELIKRCDYSMGRKQVFPELFIALGKAGKSLDWPETQVLSCRALLALDPEKCSHRLALAQVYIAVGRLPAAIEQLEWVLVKEPANGEAQTLLKNASVAETLKRGNWEDKNTSFHTKLKDEW